MFILGSTRDGRNGAKVYDWVKSLAKNRKDFDAEFVDLKDWNLPYLTDANSPSQGKYADKKTQEWSKKVASAEGFLVVTPEYNHGYPAVLKNHLDVLYAEWNNKPIGFVSYGGSAAGARSVEQLRLVSIELQMAPIRESLGIPIFTQSFDDKGKLPEYYEKKLTGQLDQLVWWANALKSARMTRNN